MSRTDDHRSGISSESEAIVRNNKRISSVLSKLQASGPCDCLARNLCGGRVLEALLKGEATLDQQHAGALLLVDYYQENVVLEGRVELATHTVKMGHLLLLEANRRLEAAGQKAIDFKDDTSIEEPPQGGGSGSVH